MKKRFLIIIFRLVIMMSSLLPIKESSKLLSSLTKVYNVTIGAHSALFMFSTHTVAPGEGDGIPLQNSYLENSKDKGAWLATVHGVAKSWKRLSS